MRRTQHIVMTGFLAVCLLSLGGLALAGTSQLPVKDGDFGCIPQAQADRYIQDFSIDTQSFGGVELCKPEVDTKKLFNDLRLIEEGKFEGKGTNLLIRGFLQADKYYTWMKGQTRGIERGNDIPFATAYNSGGYFTMQDGWAILSTLGRVGTVVHEARHTAGYSHVPCTAGPYMGTSVSGCDTTYEYGGSHAIEMEYYARVAVLGTNFHPLYQSMARMMAMGRSNVFFNKSPIQRKMAVMAKTHDGRGVLVFNNQSFSRNLPVTSTGHLKRTSFGATWFDQAQGIALDVYKPFSMNLMDGQFVANDLNEEQSNDYSLDDFSYFKLLRQDRGQGHDILDAEEFDIGLQRYFMVLNSKAEMNSYVFPEGKWRGYAKAPSQSGQFRAISPEGSEKIYFVADNRDVFELNPGNLQYSKQSWTWPQDFTSYAKTQSEVLGLSTKGEVFSIQKGQPTQAFPALQGMQVDDLISVPTYDAFEVN